MEASRPDAPEKPYITEMTQTSAMIQWKAPDSNGSPIMSYKVTIMTEGDPENPVAVIVDGNSSDCQVVRMGDGLIER